MRPRQIVEELLGCARDVARNFDTRSFQEVHDEGVVDIATVADRQISEALIARIKEIAPEANILSEESGLMGGSDMSLTIAIDDLDGTDNFFRAPDLLPWCTVITILKGEQPRFSDVVACGILEHRLGIAWTAAKGEGIETADVNGSVKLTPRVIDPPTDKRTLVLFDHYAAGAETARYAKLYEKYWVKDFGSSAFHLALVAAGFAEVYVNIAHKAHELGAGYLLVKESGGAVVDFSGRDLGEKRFDFNARYGIVAARSASLTSAILRQVSEDYEHDKS